MERIPSSAATVCVSATRTASVPARYLKFCTKFHDTQNSLKLTSFRKMWSEKSVMSVAPAPFLSTARICSDVRNASASIGRRSAFSRLLFGLWSYTWYFLNEWTPENNAIRVQEASLCRWSNSCVWGAVGVLPSTTQRATSTGNLISFNVIWLNCTLFVLTNGFSRE